MKWYKIEFYVWSNHPETRIRVVERQYSSFRYAQLGADIMFQNMVKRGIECHAYFVKEL